MKWGTHPGGSPDTRNNPQPGTQKLLLKLKSEDNCCTLIVNKTVALSIILQNNGKSKNHKITNCHNNGNQNQWSAPKSPFCPALGNCSWTLETLLLCHSLYLFCAALRKYLTCNNLQRAESYFLWFWRPGPDPGAHIQQGRPCPSSHGRGGGEGACAQEKGPNLSCCHAHSPW